ncbi:hypothetical protein Tco_1398786, partial [Tanacetum coccineum]
MPFGLTNAPASKEEHEVHLKLILELLEKDEPAVGKADARSENWIEITMKKVHRLLSMNDGDERKHVLDYTNVDLHYVEDQKKKLL